MIRVTVIVIKFAPFKDINIAVGHSDAKLLISLPMKWVFSARSSYSWTEAKDYREFIIEDNRLTCPGLNVEDHGAEGEELPPSFKDPRSILSS